MELLMDVFKCLVAIAGSLLALVIIVAIITAPFMKAKKEKAEKELMKILQNAIDEIEKEATKEENKKKTTPRKPRNTKKKEEN